MSLGLDRETRLKTAAELAEGYKELSIELAELNTQYVKACIKLREQRNKYIREKDQGFPSMISDRMIQEDDAEVDLIFHPPKEPT